MFDKGFDRSKVIYVRINKT